MWRGCLVWTTRGSVPATDVYIFLFAVQMCSGDHPASYRMGTENFLPRDKTTEAWSWQLTYFSYRVQQCLKLHLHSPLLPSLSAFVGFRFGNLSESGRTEDRKFVNNGTADLREEVSNMEGRWTWLNTVFKRYWIFRVYYETVTVVYDESCSLSFGISVELVQGEGCCLGRSVLASVSRHKRPWEPVRV
jgi:hypothetical protein